MRGTCGKKRKDNCQVPETLPKQKKKWQCVGYIMCIYSDWPVNHTVLKNAQTTYTTHTHKKNPEKQQQNVSEYQYTENRETYGNPPHINSYFTQCVAYTRLWFMDTYSAHKGSEK